MYINFQYHNVGRVRICVLHSAFCILVAAAVFIRSARARHLDALLVALGEHHRGENNEQHFQD